MAEMRQFALSLWMCLLLVSSIAARASSEADAARSVAWLQGFACPSPGQPLQVGGLETAAKTQASKATNLKYAQQSITDIRQAINVRNQTQQELSQQKRISKGMQRSLDKVDARIRERVAKMSVALVQWSLAEYVELSRLDPQFDASSNNPHPLTPFGDRLVTISGIASHYASQPGVGEYLAPIPGAVEACLRQAQTKVVEYNQSYLERSLNAAKSSQAAQRLIARYDVFKTGWGGNPPRAIVAARRVVKELEENERRLADAAERERQKQLEEDRRRQEEERQRLIAAAEKNMPNAQQLVSALRSRDVARATQVMSSGVVMTSSQTSARRGIEQVERALRDRFASTDTPPRIYEPRISSRGEIYVELRSSKGSGTMRLAFNDNQKITRIDTR